MFVAFLGTGGSVPTARRSTASILVGRGGDRMLFDCGEGTQRQLQRSLGLVHLDQIYLTHFHADHFLGLPGLLKTYDLGGREKPLVIHGPRGLRELIESLDRVLGRSRFPIELVELEPGERARPRRLRGADVPGRAPHAGARLRAGGGPAARALRRRAGAPARRCRGPRLGGAAAWGGGGRVRGPVRPADVMGESRPGRRIVISGRHRALPRHRGRRARRAAADPRRQLRRGGVTARAETGHSTAGQAGALAREAGVDLLALVHISSRYHVKAVLEEARAEFERAFAPRDFDVVEIPFPERGEPRVIENGARERGSDETAVAEPGK